MKSPSNTTPRSGVGLSLWDRVHGDPRFQSAIRALQARYGLPLPYDIRLNHQKWLEWLGRAGKPSPERARRGRAFARDILALLKKFEVPETWHIDFIAEIAGIPDDSFNDVGSPRFSYYQDANGTWKWECIITPETDLTNPATLRFIQSQQKEFAALPPQLRTPGHSRKLDWRLLYEWHRRYPLFSIEEIADKIDYAPETVKRRFREIEQAEQE